MAKRRILFVDDEPNVIEGLRRMLRRQQAEWEMEFVASGPVALARMAVSPFDVVITDLKMPEMSGAELLEKVMADYPSTARIVLSGYADDNLTSRALKATHRFLAKPVSADKLKQTVAEACNAQMMVPDDRLRALVGGCEMLPSLPTVYVELTEAMESESADAHTIAEIVNRDMAMSAKILQLVNSAFFGIGQRVSSIERTVTLLGFLRIKALVLSNHIFAAFKPEKEPTELPLERLWEHSLRIAELARDIARHEKQTDDRPDQAFMAGLLHDIGLLVIACQHANVLDEVCREARQRGLPLNVMEKEQWGVCHADVGGYLLRLWGLPSRIGEAVQTHHNPSDLSYNGLCATTVVHTADALEGELLRVQVPPGDHLCTGTLDLAYFERTGLVARLPQWRELAISRQRQRQEKGS